MPRHLLLSLAAGTAVVLAACSASDSPRIGALIGPGGDTTHDTTSTTAQLVVTPSFVQLAATSTTQLSTNAPSSLASQVRWSSLQGAIATVSQTGLVTALTAGTATIVARYAFDTSNVAAATVVVTPFGGTSTP